MRYTILIGYFCSSFLFTTAQHPDGHRRFQIPSLSDILMSPSDLSTEVVNLSSSGTQAEAQVKFGDSNGGFANTQNGFGDSVGGIVKADASVHREAVVTSTDHSPSHGTAVQHESAENVHNSIGQNSITDTLGNVPPSPTGTHVDLPGEHGNPHDFPVIHHGEIPIQDLHPNSLAARIDNLSGRDQSVPIPMESSHGPQTVSHGPANMDHSTNPFHATNVHNIAGRPISKEHHFEDLTLLQDNGDGFMHTGVQQPVRLFPQESPKIVTTDQQHSMHKNIESIASKADGFISQSDGFLTSESVGHKDITQQSLDSMHSDLPVNSHSPVDGNLFVQRENDGFVGNTHIDLPGQHGVPLHGEPVVHREGNIMQQGVPAVNVHVDMPGDHNNPLNGGPVIHREIHHGSRPHLKNVNMPHPNTAEQDHKSESAPKDTVSTTIGKSGQHLSGIHIDEPGVHGNMLNEPALHLPPGATVQDAIAAGIIPDPSLPAANEHKAESPPNMSSVQPIGNVHVGLPVEHGNLINGQSVIHREGGSGSGHQNEVQKVKNAEIGLNVDSVHVDLPGQHNNPLDGTPVIHRERQQNIDDGFGNRPQTLFSGSSIFGDVHVDMPGEHGNLGEHPVIHRDSVHTGPTVISPIENVHVDMPGQHGNPENGIPIIHRETNHIGTQRESNNNVHVNLPGQHGNHVVGQPVIHKDATHIGPQVNIPIGNVHIDNPGQHGVPVNGLPTVHREITSIGPQSDTSKGKGHIDLSVRHGVPANGLPTFHGDSVHTSQPVTPTGNVHIDLPGQHGVPANGLPTIHREALHTGTQAGVPIGNVHIDLPGQHGVPTNGLPTIHREDIHTGTQPDAPTGNVHIDLPGQHGVPANGLPTIHREAIHTGSQAGAPIENVHIDLPGQHGVPVNGLPTIHREAIHTGSQTGSQAGAPIDNVHIDLPGQHGVPANGLPTIHRDVKPFAPQVVAPTDNIHIDLPGQHGFPPNGFQTVHRDANHIGTHVGIQKGNAHIGLQSNHGNTMHGDPSVQKESHITGGFGKPIHHKHFGIHIDAPGEHGNKLNEPALHLPTGATIEDAQKAGVIPRPNEFHPSISVGVVPVMSPIVPTGVFPGTKNVPVPKNVGKKLTYNGIVPKLITQHIQGSRKEQSLGDMLGLPTVNTKGSISKNKYDRTNIGVIDDNSVLLKKGGRKRKGRHGDRRHKGRKWQQKTSTTSAPKKSSAGGIKIIRKTNPNPLSVLGDALRSAFNRNSSGGGLLGSLIRSALKVQQRPQILPPGGVIIRPIRIQPVGGQLFGRLFGGKK